MINTRRRTYRPSNGPAVPSGFFTARHAALQRSLGLLFQDVGKTTRATADGHPVRVATCPWSGLDHVAPSAAASPLLKGSGSVWRFLYDGTNDKFVVPAFAITGNFTLLIAESSAGDVMLWGNSGANVQFRLGAAGNTLSIYDGVNNPASDALAVARGTARVLGFNRAANVVTFSENGTAKGTGAFTEAVTVDQFGDFQTGGGLSFAGSEWGSLMYASSLGVDDLAAQVAYLIRLTRATN